MGVQQKREIAYNKHLKGIIGNEIVMKNCEVM